MIILGTCHGEDFLYLFRSKLIEEAGIKQIVPGTTEHVVRQLFLELWTNFAKTGNPNSEKSELINVEWKPLDNSNEFNCLTISNNPTLIKESSILREIIKKTHGSN